jgi:hypothetical protein
LSPVDRNHATYWSDGTGADEEIRAAVIYPPSVAQARDDTMILVVLPPTQLRSNSKEDRTDAVSGLPRKPMRALHGVWTVELELDPTKGAAECRFDAWIQRSDSAPARTRASYGYAGRQSYFLEPDKDEVDPRTTLNGIATLPHKRLWVVGAMRFSDSSISDYSAAGPNRNCPERFEGPDVVMWADQSRNVPGLLLRGALAGSRQRVSGTSMAAALFTRVLYDRLASGGRTDFTWWLCPSTPSRPVLVPEGAPQHADFIHRGEFTRYC